MTNGADLRDTLPTVAVRVGVVRLQNAQRLSQIVQRVNRLLPLRQFGLCHVKRVKRCAENAEAHVLLAPVDAANAFDSEEGFDAVCQAEVPAIAPVTVQQLHRWNAVWPVTFHEGQQKCVFFAVFFLLLECLKI